LGSWGFDQNERRRRNENGRGRGIKLPLGQQRNGAMMVRLAGVVVDQLVQNRRRRKRLEK
jgi:hypothetical protein